MQKVGYELNIESIKNKFLGVEVEFDVERIKISARKRDESEIELDSEEDVLNEFKERLNSITKVYKSIEETFSSKASGDKAIKLVM